MHISDYPPLILQHLRIEATKAAKWRGHKLGKWNTSYENGRSRATAECLVCHADVQCNTKPLPNEIDIGGPAVALSCPAESRPAGCDGPSWTSVPV